MKQRKKLRKKQPLTGTELLPSRVDACLSLRRDHQFLADIFSSDLGDLEHLNKRLILHEGALRTGKTEEKIIL